MATDFENVGYEAVPKTVSRIKIADESEELIPEGLRPIAELKMAADFENMGYEALTKTISRIKMAAETDERVPEAPRPITEIKCPPISKIWAMKR